MWQASLSFCSYPIKKEAEVPIGTSAVNNDIKSFAPGTKALTEIVDAEYGNKEVNEAQTDDDIYKGGTVTREDIDKRTSEGEGENLKQKKDSLAVRVGITEDYSNAETSYEPLKEVDQPAKAESADKTYGTDITYYKALSYPKLRRPQGKIYKSFRQETEYGDAESLTDKYAYPDVGKPRDRSDLSAGIPDPINNLAFGDDYPDTESDLIKFTFTPLRLDQKLSDLEASPRPIIFRAYINTLNDSFQPSWDENQDQGRADAKIMLNGWARQIGIDFTVVIHSANESANVWSKLAELARLTYPDYGGTSGFTGTYCAVTIGDLYRNQAMYVTDLSFDWDSETPWEIEEGKQAPLYTSVSMTLGYIGKDRPEYKSKVFDLEADTTS